MYKKEHFVNVTTIYFKAVSSGKLENMCTFFGCEFCACCCHLNIALRRGDLATLMALKLFQPDLDGCEKWFNLASFAVSLKKMDHLISLLATTASIMKR